LKAFQPAPEPLWLNLHRVAAAIAAIAVAARFIALAAHP